MHWWWLKPRRLGLLRVHSVLCIFKLNLSLPLADKDSHIQPPLCWLFNTKWTKRAVMPYIKAFSFTEIYSQAFRNWWFFFFYDTKHICVYAWALERQKLTQKQQKASFSGLQQLQFKPSRAQMCAGVWNCYALSIRDSILPTCTDKMSAWEVPCWSNQFPARMVHEPSP